MSAAMERTMQIALAFINFIFCALGITGVGVGGWALIYREDGKVLTLIDTVTNDLGLLQNAAILLIAAGITLFALGILGCVATYRDQRCLRVIYLSLITLCTAVSAAACVAGFMFRDQVQGKLLTHLRDKLLTEYEGFTTSTMDFSQAFDYAQVEFQCCGVESYLDFKNASKWTVKNSATVPLSCCVLSDKDSYLKHRFLDLADRKCVLFPNSTNSYIGQPCHGPLKLWMQEMAVVLGGIAIGTICVQVLGFILMAVLMKLQVNSNFLYRDTLGRH